MHVCVYVLYAWHRACVRILNIFKGFCNGVSVSKCIRVIVGRAKHTIYLYIYIIIVCIVCNIHRVSIVDEISR